MDLPGGDYKQIRNSTYRRCFTACIGDNFCKAFAFVAKKRECWLNGMLGRPKATKGVELGVNESFIERQIQAIFFTSRPA
ncbi:PAN domain-containing protein [Rhizobium tibeticum]|uniref:PAN domain-containing protein n=1 Tax=Rhizobium tibeticum TaxID=501024 RepID=A0A1H8WJ94_9HYPH|nr:hypothetical protein RTCCBAU85039_6461 [Rhizobium tibeticum]SEP27679.1 PAN domain-containing protein [Rhizobium tibeticum]